MTYQDAVSYLESLVDFERLGFRRHFADTVSLDSIRALLERLGSPQRGLPCVHIAGTKGKGSTAAMLQAMLLQSGHRVGLFSSPHLVSFRERIRLNGEPVSEDDIVWAVEQVQGPIEALRAEGKLNPSTFFEAYTAMAYLLFRRHGVDLAIMEVGLGGRLDATNTCEPVACAITTLGLDHTEILGDTIEQISAEKAGILKPGVPAVYAPQDPAAETVLREVGESIGAPLQPAPAVLEATAPAKLPVPPASGSAGVSPAGGRLKLGPSNEPRLLQRVTVQMPSGPLTAEIPLLGRHQATNLAVALGLVTLLREQGYSLPDDALRTGLRAMSWPGRMEIVAIRPWIVLDVAHNEAAAVALAATLPGALEYDRLIAVLGLSAEKDAAAFCRTLAPLTDVAILTQAAISRALPAADLANLTGGLWRQSVVEPDVRQALQRALQLASPRDCVLITGSFYVVGEAMEVLWDGANGDRRTG